MKNNRFIYIILGGLVVSNIFTITKINTLRINFEQRLNDMQIIRNSNNYSYPTTIDEKTSIIESYDLDVGEDIDISDYTVNLSLKVIPKEMGEESKGSFKVGNNIIEMKKDGISFIGEAKVNIFEDTDIKFILETQGIQKIENIENYGLREKFITNIFTYYEGNLTYNQKEKSHKFNGHNVIDIQASYESQAIEKLEIITKKNNDILKRDEIDLKGDKYLKYKRHPFNEEIILEKGEKLEVYALIKMENGLTYKSIISKYEANGTANLIQEYEETIYTEIVDKDEKALFKIQ